MSPSGTTSRRGGHCQIDDRVRRLLDHLVEQAGIDAERDDQQDGDHYDGEPIPDHSTRPDLNAPEVSWNPVISPAGLVIYQGQKLPGWKGSGVIGGLSSRSLIRVALEGKKAREVARYDMGQRIREVEETPDGGLWILEDGAGARLLELVPQ